MAALQPKDSAAEQIEPVPLIGRDEMNLAEFPIALLADFAPKGQKTLCFEGGNGQLTVTGSDAYGLPTALDADVIVALIYLTKLRNDFKDVKVNFSRYELIKLLNWPDKGSSYNRLDQALNRWGGVWLVYDKCWWNNRLKRYVSAKMHILESVVITESGKASDGQRHLPLSTFTWNKTFVESCQADNLRQLDLDEYFSLKSAVSKRLYRFLGKRFYLQDEWAFDLNEIAFDRVGLSRSYEGNAGKIKEKLQPALEELEAIGFLHPLRRDERYNRIDRGQWTIRLVRHSPALAAPLPAAAPAAASEPPLVTALVAHGIDKAQAARLTKQHEAAHIETMIEYLAFEIAKKPGKIADPAAWLVSAIRDGRAKPKGFISRADREAAAEKKRQDERQEAESRRLERERKAREKTERQATAAYWEALTPEQQAAHDAEAIAQADAEERALIEPGPMQKYGMGILRHNHIRRLLEAQGKLPPAKA